MFGFYCFKRRKSKIENNSFDGDNKTSRNSCSLPGRLTDGENENCFSQCFRGNRTCRNAITLTHTDQDMNDVTEGTNNCTHDKRENDVIYTTLIEKVQNSAKQESLAQKLFNLSKFGWYWGPLSQRESNEKLLGQKDGSFLVRDSTAKQYVLTLTFKSHGQIFHTHIDHIGGMFSLESGSDFSTVEELIKYSMTHPFFAKRHNPSGNNNPQFSYEGFSCQLNNNNVMYVNLIEPISRFTQVRTLQYLCRFIIRQYVRADMIPNLPLPESLKEYIEEGRSWN